MPLTITDHLIDLETGERNRSAFKADALMRARYEFGGANPPYYYLRRGWEWCEDRYQSLRVQWRLEKGLADDRVKVPFPEALARDIARWGTE